MGRPGKRVPARSIPNRIHNQLRPAHQTPHLMGRTTPLEQRKALLAAVKVLTNNGQHALAQQLWDASSKV